jgi:alpha,alpha-trehalose phosphorylase
LKPFIHENRLTNEEIEIDASLFSVANGTIGIRGDFAEGITEHDYHQTLINGIYDFYDYHYEEFFNGFPKHGQRIVNVFDGQTILIKIDNRYINKTNATLTSLKQSYEIGKGFTLREAVYDINGYQIHIHEKKFIPKQPHHIIYIELTIFSPNYGGTVVVESYLKQPAKEAVDSTDPRSSHDVLTLKTISIDKQQCQMVGQTVSSNMSVRATMHHSIEFDDVEQFETGIKVSKKIPLQSPIKLTKWITYESSLYDDMSKNTKRYTIEDYDTFQKEEEERLSDFWKKSFIEMENKSYESILNYNLYQLDRSGGESPLHNIAAKGLSGEGYEGHYFWDTEIYFIPFFILSNPEKAKRLLMYRYNHLLEAREEARKLGVIKGVKFPWRTINGTESSPFFEAGSAQYHINLDIAYAIIRYYDVTEDRQFLDDAGFEMLFEIAQFFIEVVSFSEIDNHYHLNTVTGPDEYTVLVDDNYYTNSMLKFVFERLFQFSNPMIDSIKNSLKNISENIWIGINSSLNIAEQDRTFLSKKLVDHSILKKPLLTNYHPLYIYRHQILKQADTMLSMVLLHEGNRTLFHNSYNYYEAITTHDSSLSRAIYGICAFRLGEYKKAITFFDQVLKTDTDNIQGNTNHGLHLANLGGSYLMFIYGIAGIEIKADFITINPIILPTIGAYKFNILVKNVLAKISISDIITIDVDKTLSIRVYDQVYTVNGTLNVPLQNIFN